MKLQKAIFLDRDGVINRERGTYTFRREDFEVLPGVPEALSKLKSAGYLLIVITNQAGISKGLYSLSEMQDCHDKMQEECGGLIDEVYYCMWHPDVSKSLARKPQALMLERAIAKWQIDPAHSWMVGDQSRDLEAAAALGIKGIGIGALTNAMINLNSLSEVVDYITDLSIEP
jgi:D-glycero-D-manno-heptose 1,7-bisphosphate phosphatase